MTSFAKVKGFGLKAAPNPQIHSMFCDSSAVLTRRDPLQRSSLPPFCGQRAGEVSCIADLDLAHKGRAWGTTERDVGWFVCPRQNDGVWVPVPHSRGRGERARISLGVGRGSGNGCIVPWRKLGGEGVRGVPLRPPVLHLNNSDEHRHVVGRSTIPRLAGAAESTR